MEVTFLIAMFFKRHQPKAPIFQDQISVLSTAGYETKSTTDGTAVKKQGFAALLREAPEGGAAIAETGLAIGDEIAVLTDLGFQKIFLTPSGKKTPALAEHLKGLHAFVEGVGASLGATLYYNDGLGTTNGKHIYDRVEGRDHGHSARPWE